MDKFTPSRYFSWVVHVDGLGERHDAAVDRDGVFDEAVAAIKQAKERGFRVTTNSTFFNTDSPKTVRDVLDFLNNDLGVDAMMISPAYAYEKAPDQEHFLGVDQTRKLFREAFAGKRKGWRLNHSPLFLDFLEGKADFQCTAWGVPSYSVLGWQRPCYLMADGYASSYKELVETTDWDAYGRGKDERCDNCMAHCGYEPSVGHRHHGVAQAVPPGPGQHPLTPMSTVHFRPGPDEEPTPALRVLPRPVSYERRTSTRRGDLPGLPDLDPETLRRLEPGALECLARDIRGFLVAALASNGGHLGSNLGIVEVTLALHRVFDSPTDRIVWDTGHQAYVHKLVTGRAAAFAELRQGGGLSGYPNRAESAHDLVENSHASTALSYAYGLARATRLTGASGRVVAVVGDGAITGGLAYEALNNIGASGAPVIVVLNDNGRSYAPTISRLTTAPGASEGRPATASGAARRLGLATPADGHDDRDPAAFFEALGLGYLGPVDGHDIAAVDLALRAAADDGGPVVLHVHTVKGKGYGPAEDDEEKCLHDVGPFDPGTGRAPAGNAPAATYTAAFTEALLAEAAIRPEVVAITAAMPGPTGLLPFAARHPDRFFDVGIAEQHAVVTAAGMAMAGLRPVVAIYSTFLNRAWDQLYYDVGLHQLPVVFCIDRAGVTGDDGASHHGVLDLSLLTKVPGMTVLAPSSYEEVAVMLHEALAITTGPVAIRWPKTPAVRADVTGSGLTARHARTGSDVCLLGVGKMLAACEEAADLLQWDGISASVWDVRVATPSSTRR